MLAADRDRLAAALARLLLAAWERRVQDEKATPRDQLGAAGDEEVRDDARASRSSA